MRAVFLLAAALAAATAPAADARCFFRPGDTWVLSGDSITYIDLFRQTVADALDHFHPGHGMRIVNTGVWGQLAQEAKGKGLELRPNVVSIMLGMNNVIHHDYPVVHDFEKGVIGRYPVMPYPDLKDMTPERRLNQTIVIDRKGDVPQVAGETTNVGIYPL